MKALNVVITGAAGRIAYSLIPLILTGHVFGPDTSIILRLLDIPMSADKLAGVVMEIEDSGYALLEKLVATTDADEAFVDADVVVLLGGFPRLPGMERKDLLIKNAECIQAQCKSLNKFGTVATKVLVVANPANTNTLVAIQSAPSIPPANFTCLTRLDQERLRFICAQKVSVATSSMVKAGNVQDVFIWGNHSTTQVAYLHTAHYLDSKGQRGKVADVLSGTDYEEILKRVQNRGGEIIKALQMSSALSAAEAIAKHLQDWLSPSPTSTVFSMGVLGRGNGYDIAGNIVFSFPCQRTAQGEYSIAEGLEVSSEMKELLRESEKELLEERDKVKDFL